MVGTYVRTNRSVRVNIRLLHTPSNNVLAMSSATIQLSPEVRSLLATSSMGGMGFEPSVGTRLNPHGAHNTAYNVTPDPRHIEGGAQVSARSSSGGGSSTIDTFLNSFNQSPPGP
jgi:hypothetical protein